jgi:hypothetical protein
MSFTDLFNPSLVGKANYNLYVESMNSVNENVSGLLTTENLIANGNSNLSGLTTLNNLVVNGSSNIGSLPVYAEFYALMAPDNSATIAVGAPILFPRLGVNDGSLNIIALSSSQFQLAKVGNYNVFFQASFNEAGQLALLLNGVQVAHSVVGRATGTNQCVCNCLISTSAINATLSVINAQGNSTALTMTPSAGGVDAVSANLLISLL